ncbi:unnamed protein product [Lasius platythorax]|uniref:Uncharacterized protein n=1 Tax=Lasius platythorax TaxID=488582 RepID=A0AAV2P8N5_9HYME
MRIQLAYNCAIAIVDEIRPELIETETAIIVPQMGARSAKHNRKSDGGHFPTKMARSLQESRVLPHDGKCVTTEWHANRGMDRTLGESGIKPAESLRSTTTAQLSFYSNRQIFMALYIARKYFL